MPEPDDVTQPEVAVIDQPEPDEPGVQAEMAQAQVFVREAGAPSSTAVLSPNAVTTLEQFEGMMAIAEKLLDTGFLPVELHTPAQVVAVTLTGQELGIPMMMSLRLIHIVKGKPGSAAELMLAMFFRAGGRVQWLRFDEREAKCRLVRKNGDEHVHTFSVDDARRAGLVHERLKLDAAWVKYRPAMLRARCLSAGLRAFAPDVIGGLYTPDELGAEMGAGGEIIPEDRNEIAGPMTADPMSDDQIKLLKMFRRSHHLNDEQRTVIDEFLSEPRDWQEAHKVLSDVEAVLTAAKRAEREQKAKPPAATGGEPEPQPATPPDSETEDERVAREDQEEHDKQHQSDRE